MSFYSKVQYKIKPCPLAIQEHKRSRRQFAHTFHRNNVICVAPEFFDLPYEYQAGILLHELGHLSYGPGERHSETDADRIAFIISGVHIHRRQFEGMQRLESVNRADLREAEIFLRRHTDLWK